MRNKIILKIIFFFSFLMCLSFLKAQEVLYPLNGNPVIKQYLNAHPAKSNVTFRIQSADDTFSLAANHPFVDDFSRQGIYPYDSLWSDSAAFINTTFCDQPVTIGVATLDGIDKYGVPYDSLNGATDTADFLTSKPIHLFYPGDTTIWLSFYYQPQGLGDEPEPTDSLPYQQGDSLTLQFLDSSGNWIEVWSVDGHVDTAFQRVNIRITGGAYLYDGFRFRFMNYATRNGNRDHWNLDYVWLNRNRHENDPIPDVALATIQQSLIKEYQSMPYPHYKSLSASQLNGFLKDSLVDLVIDIGYGVTNISFGNLITDESGTVLNTFTSGNLSLTSNTTISTTVQLNQPSLATAFQGYPGKSAEFLVRDFLNWGSQTLIFNDTNYYTQKFHNYYAYDDGSAEWAYGIPEAHAKIAYKFDVKMTDTLRGVQIYFNPVGDIVHNKLFSLCYWSDVDVNANSENLVYKKINCKPYNIDSINGFATYLFDTLLIVPSGPMYPITCLPFIPDTGTILPYRDPG
ncbi:MAG: hypothetical protein NT126_11620 [Bacteroidetes bacterium]|nr:hypothetical protein [Bacteroidota bacterium]